MRLEEGLLMCNLRLASEGEGLHCRKVQAGVFFVFQARKMEAKGGLFFLLLHTTRRDNEMANVSSDNRLALRLRVLNSVAGRALLRRRVVKRLGPRIQWRLFRVGQWKVDKSRLSSFLNSLHFRPNFCSNDEAAGRAKRSPCSMLSPLFRDDTSTTAE